MGMKMMNELINTNFLCIHQKWGIKDISTVHNFVDFCLDFLIINVDYQTLFKSYFEHHFFKYHVILTKYMKSLRENQTLKFNNSSKIIYVGKKRNPVLVVVKKEYLKLLITSIFSDTDWNKKVGKITDIPIVFIRAIKICKINIYTIFPNLQISSHKKITIMDTDMTGYLIDSVCPYSSTNWTDKIPNFVDEIIVTTRILYHINKPEPNKDLDEEDHANMEEEKEPSKKKRKKIEEEKEEDNSNNKKIKTIDLKDINSEDFTKIINSMNNNNISDDDDEEEKDCNIDVSESGSDLGMYYPINTDSILLPTEKDLPTVRISEFNTSVNPYTFTIVIFSMIYQYIFKPMGFSKKYNMIKLFVLVKKKLLDSTACVTNNQELSKKIEKVIQHIKLALYDRIDMVNPVNNEEKTTEELAQQYSNNIELKKKLRNIRITDTQNVELDMLNDLNCLFELFKDTFKLLYKHKNGLKSHYFSNRKANLIPIEEQEKIVSEDGTKTTIKLKFKRDLVDGLDLLTTINIMVKKFECKDFLQNSVNIHFDDNYSYLIIEKKSLKEIQQLIIPYMICHNFLVSKKTTLLSSPIYPILTYNLLSNMKNPNGRILVYTMKSILKLIDESKHNQNFIKNYMIDENQFHQVQFYLLLPFIINRAKDTNFLLELLLQPYQNFCYSIIKRKRNEKSTKTEFPLDTQFLNIGIKTNIPTIYSALKAFIYINAPHYILSCVVIQVIGFIKLNVSIEHQKQISNAIKLLIKLDQIANTTDQIILIPENFLLDNGYHYPSHRVLYELCCSEFLSDEIAFLLFLGISIKKNINTPFYYSQSRKVAPDKRKILKKSLLSIKNNNNKINNYNNTNKNTIIKFEKFIYLMQAIEHIGFMDTTINQKYSLEDNNKNYRGKLKKLETNNGVFDKEFFLDKNWIKDKVPIQVDLQTMNPIFKEQVFPIWKSEFFNEWTISPEILFKFGDDLDVLPFYECHRDLLQILILYTIDKVIL